MHHPDIGLHIKPQVLSDIHLHRDKGPGDDEPFLEKRRYYVKSVAQKEEKTCLESVKVISRYPFLQMMIIVICKGPLYKCSFSEKYF